MKIRSILAIALCLVLALSLAACGEAATKEADLSAVLTEVNSKYGITDDIVNTISDSGTLELYYGIKADDVNSLQPRAQRLPQPMQLRLSSLKPWMLMLQRG